MREMREETGLEIEPGRLLHVCDYLPGGGTHVVHLAFEGRRIGGVAGEVMAGLDTRPIRRVEFVRLDGLASLGFGARFAELATAGFPGLAVTWALRPASACDLLSAWISRRPAPASEHDRPARLVTQALSHALSGPPGEPGSRDSG